MVATAELGALAHEIAGVGDPHPERLHATGHGVELGQELRRVEGVQHVGRGDVEADHRAHWHGHDRRVVGCLEAALGDRIGAVEDAHHLSPSPMPDRHRAVDRSFDGHHIARAGHDPHMFNAQFQRHEGNHQRRIFEVDLGLVEVGRDALGQLGAQRHGVVERPGPLPALHIDDHHILIGIGGGLDVLQDEERDDEQHDHDHGRNAGPEDFGGRVVRDLGRQFVVGLALVAEYDPENHRLDDDEDDDPDGQHDEEQGANRVALLGHRFGQRDLRAGQSREREQRQGGRAHDQRQATDPGSP